MRRIFFVFALASIFGCQSRLNNEGTERVVQGEAQGTTYTIKYLGEEKLDLKEKMDSLLGVIDQSLSTYVSTSLISKLNDGKQVKIDVLLKEMFLLSKEINNETEGAFDPTIGPLIKAWGFDFANPQRMDSAKVNRLLSICGFRNFELKGDSLLKQNTSSKLNFNAIAQGYSTDLMAVLLDSSGIDNYFIELGGEVKAKGKNEKGVFWRIGIDRPKDNNLERDLSAIVSLDNKAMATSGNYRKFYEVDGKRYSHTLNPKSGYPAENSLLSATVVTESCAEADALATAFMVMGLDQTKKFLKENRQVVAYLIYDNGRGGYLTFSTETLEGKLEEL